MKTQTGLDDLVDGLIPRGGSVLFAGMPHRLKSWFALGLALASTKPGNALGPFQVKRGFRTEIVVQDMAESEIYSRLAQLVIADQFADCNQDMVSFIRLPAHIAADKPELIVLDSPPIRWIDEPQVLMRFLSSVDEMRRSLLRDDAYLPAVAVVHCTQKEDSDEMPPPSWADTVVRFTGKVEHIQKSGGRKLATVDVSIERKLDADIGGRLFRLTLQLDSPMPLRLEPIGEAV